MELARKIDSEREEEKRTRRHLSNFSPFTLTHFIRQLNGILVYWKEIIGGNYVTALKCSLSLLVLLMNSRNYFF
jgi:hypothetical protein